LSCSVGHSLQRSRRHPAVANAQVLTHMAQSLWMVPAIFICVLMLPGRWQALVAAAGVSPPPAWQPDRLHMRTRCELGHAVVRGQQPHAHLHAYCPDGFKVSSSHFPSPDPQKRMHCK